MKKFLLFFSLVVTAVAQVTIDWGDVDKTGSSLAHLTTRSASDLSSGTLAAARLPSFTLNFSGTLHTTPVTFTAGVGTATLANQSANTVFAGPTSGAAAAPTFRALTQADTQTATAANRNALAPRGGVAFDGTTNTRIYSALTGQNIGTDAFAVSFVFQVPSANPAAGFFPGLIGLSSSNTSSAGVSNFTAYLQASSSALRFSLRGPSSSSDINFADDATFITDFAGKRVHVVFIRNASGNPSLFVNGVARTLAYSTSGTAPGWQAPITSTYFNVGFGTSADVFVGSIYSATLYNLALSSGDVQEIYELGGAVPERFKFGSQTFYGSDFSATTDGFSANLTTLTANTDGIGGRNDTLRVALSGGSSSLHQVSRQFSGRFLKTWRMSADVYIPSTNANPFGVSLMTLGGGTVGATTTTKDTWVTLQTTEFLENTDQQIRLRVPGTVSADGDVFYVRNVAVVAAGAVVHLALDDGVGYQLIDQSSNKLHATMTTSGATHIIAKTRGVVRFTTSTNGNQQILGQQALPANARVMSWTINSSGTPTVSLGNASGGAQFLSSATLASGLNDVTLLTRFCSTNNLWVSSNSTATLQHTIYYEVVD